MLTNLLIFFVALIAVTESAAVATKSSIRVAEALRIPKHIVGFIIVAFISVLPEALVAITAALSGVPALGLGTLLGSNVADLTLIFALLVLLGKRPLKVKSHLLGHVKTFPLFLIMTLLLGIDGYYSRWDGFFLIITGSIFYFLIFRRSFEPSREKRVSLRESKFHLAALTVSLLILIAGAHYTVEAATRLATDLKVSPILIGLLIISLGTTMPELFFSLKSVKKEEDDLAIGDILGSVLADATILVGILALISPFAFPVQIIYVAGIFMLLAGILLIYLMQSDKKLTRHEALLLLTFWGTYVLTEVIVNK